MDTNNSLVHYGHLQIEELQLLKKLANEYSLNFVHDGIVQVSERNPKYPIAAFWEFVNHAKYSNMIAIWNGKQCYGPLISDLCKNKGIPRFYMEWGLLPQADNFLIDPNGFCGDSVLCSDISWVDAADMSKLYSVRADMQRVNPIRDDNYILIPTQIENDSQILYYSKYLNMYDFICDVLIAYPNKKIIIKVHPKNNETKYLTSWNDKYTRMIQSDRVSIITSNISFLELASKASIIVGLTSTCLYEAAILGKKVIALGNHPLNIGENNPDRILAGVLALNINRKTGSIKNLLDRFQIHPL